METGQNESWDEMNLGSQDNPIDMDTFDIETGSIPDVDDTVTESAWTNLFEGIGEATM